MRKIIAVFAFLSIFFTFSSKVQAQLQQGNLILGANADLFRLNFGFGNTSNIDFSIAPRVGYFIQNNIALGGIVNLGITKYKGVEATYAHRFNAFGRYYIPKGEVYNPLNDGRFFVEGQAGFGGQAGVPFGFNISAGLGYAYFVSSSVALEGTAMFHSIFGAGSNTGLELRLGFSIHLPSQRLKDEYHKVKGELAPTSSTQL